MDEDEWQRGYAKGLELYCIPELAYSKGRRGTNTWGVCPNDTSFTQFERGRQEYLLEQRLGELQQELERTEQDIYQLDQQIRSENDSKQRDYYRAQRERAIRHYGVRREYNRIRFPDRVIQFPSGADSKGSVCFAAAAAQARSGSSAAAPGRCRLRCDPR